MLEECSRLKRQREENKHCYIYTIIKKKKKKKQWNIITLLQWIVNDIFHCVSVIWGKLHLTKPTGPSQTLFVMTVGPQGSQ